MTDTTLAYSADELVQLAKALDDMAEAMPVGAPGPDGLAAMQWCQSLGGAAQNLLLMAQRDYLADTTEPLADIVVTTKEATAALAKIKAIDKIVEVVGDVMLLATVIWLQKWNLVLPTVKELRNDIRSV